MNRVNLKVTDRRNFICRFGVILGIVSCAAYTVAGDVPMWWVSRGVTNGQTPGNDFEAVNAGQLKHVAKMAADEMNAVFPQGAGVAIDQMVASFGANNSEYSDFDAVNIGQIKAMAKPYYNRLIEFGLASGYPWSDSDPARNDYALANAGQLKSLFSFEIEAVDSDNDGLPDWWEQLHHGNLDFSASDDADGDGLTELAELLLGFNPTMSDSDNDGTPDADSVPPNDPDQDGLLNSQEAALGRNPHWRDHPAVELNSSALSFP